MPSPFGKSVLHALKNARRATGRRLERLLIGREPVTIFSDDCWGGEFYRTLGGVYTTPVAGAFIPAAEYLTFLENIFAPDAFELAQRSGTESYPVGRTPYATIHFMHARSWNEAAQAFSRRARRINRARLFFKIDFGKEGHTQRDVERWNALALPNAVALLPPCPQPDVLDFSRVHQGLRVREWTFDGAAMFHLSRRSFDFHHWIRTGRLRRCWWNRALNFLFWDKLAPSDLLRALRIGATGNSTPVSARPAAGDLQDGPVTGADPTHHGGGRVATR